MNLPIASSGPRVPDKQRPRPVPKAIRDVIVMMVRGRPDDPDQAPLDFITAAKACGVQPDIMRKWLDRPEVRSFLRAERKAYRAMVNAGNEAALARARDQATNPMATVRAVQALEQLDEEEHAQGQGIMPGFRIVISQEYASRMPDSSVIDVTPSPAPEPAEREPTARPMIRATPRSRR